MSNMLYLECTSGISGDMTVAALLDLGADRGVLEKVLQSLPIHGFKIKISRVKKSGLDVCDFHVKLEQTYENHDHDMDYLHGTEHEHSHVHHHIHEEKHTHEHSHRGLAQILKIIEETQMTERAKEIAADIFWVLARAEGKAHGVPPEEVHFHEVGAVDSIVDIVAAAVCLDNLDITQVIVPQLCEGSGTVRCQHGVMPVPVPAVVHIAREHQLSLCITDVKGELITPTGAAIAAAITTGCSLPPRFTIEKTGMGAGKRNYERPSILRAMMIRTESPSRDVVYKLESNIDDCTGETLGYVMERLFEAGARDVHYSPVFMKKNRPAYQLNVICTQEDISAMEEIIFSETTTIGIRHLKMERTILQRKVRTVQTSLGEAEVKVCQWDSMEKIYPEYDSTASLARKHGTSYSEMWKQIQTEANEQGLTKNE